MEGKIDRIEELEEARLNIDGTENEEKPIGDIFKWKRYAYMATANIL